MAKKKCLIIYNPISGKGINKKILNEYKKILNDRGYSVKFVATKYCDHAVQTVRNAGNYDIVFSIGGDGTLNEVIRGNYSRNKRLTICPLPGGTCNDVATMLGYGKDPINNLMLALDGEINDIDIGMINNDPFAYVVGIGKFMNISYETSSQKKRESGYRAYLKEGVIEFFNSMKIYQAEVVVDGVKLDGNYSLIMVSNANHIAGINNFYKDVFLNDGKMEVLLCKAKNKRELVSDFLNFFIRRKSKKIISLKAHEVFIKMLDSKEKNWCVDGEKYEYSGYEYNIRVQDKMQFLIPKNKVKKLFKSNVEF